LRPLKEKVIPLNGSAY
jgi:hypothetical protein